MSSDDEYGHTIDTKTMQMFMNQRDQKGIVDLINACFAFDIELASYLTVS